MSAKKIVVCSSTSFYSQVIELSYEIERLGLNVILPKTAQKMKTEGRENDRVVIDWSTASSGYHGKALLIKEHFKEIEMADAVLVTNYEKHGKPNYIGPNVLMEMTIGFYLGKPLYILNEAPADSPLIDEILGLEPTFLRGDINKLPDTAF
jgi:hypothetical protein